MSSQPVVGNKQGRGVQQGQMAGRPGDWETGRRAGRRNCSRRTRSREHKHKDRDRQAQAGTSRNKQAQAGRLAGTTRPRGFHEI